MKTIYRILLIETGEYLYRDKHGNLCLQKDIPVFGDKRGYNIAEYKTRDKANMIFTRRSARLKLSFVITLHETSIYLNKESRCLFEVMEARLV